MSASGSDVQRTHYWGEGWRDFHCCKKSTLLKAEGRYGQLAQGKKFLEAENTELRVRG